MCSEKGVSYLLEEMCSEKGVSYLLEEMCSEKGVSYLLEEMCSEKRVSYLLVEIPVTVYAKCVAFVLQIRLVLWGMGKVSPLTLYQRHKSHLHGGEAEVSNERNITLNI